MDFSIRLRTAEDDLADKRAALKALITPPTLAIAGRQERGTKQPKGRAAKSIRTSNRHPLAQPTDGA
jgi:hypothetical protein